MSGVGFQLALELSSVFPVKELVSSAASQILIFARDLRKSGSDVVVEEDLAEVFGRGRVSSELEKKFKDAVNIHTFTPLSKGSQMYLDSGPGPTLIRAFRDRRYFATFITLSMLGYFHNREQLASMLAQSMTKRFEMKIEGASSDPGYEGIMNTMAACSSQSSAFAWTYYCGLVEERLKTSIPAYHYSTDYIRVSPSLLLGAMDYLYLIQSLPEDRKMTVSNETGCITLIIWAHYILELTVVITDTPKGQIVFGNAKEPHVYISWSKEKKDDAGELFWPLESDDDDAEPTIRLHERDISIVLTESTPEPERRISIITEERHPLCGYGVTYLRRVLNVDVITLDNDPIYEESVKLITALAIHVSRRLDRNLNFRNRLSTSTPQASASRSWTLLEKWRVMASAKLIFNGLSIDPTGVESYEKFLAETKLDETTCPNSFSAFLKKVKLGSSALSPAKRLLKQVQHLAKIVLIFAHINEIESCSDLPLILQSDQDHSLLSSSMTEILGGPGKRSAVEPQEIFHAVVCLLSSTVLDNRDDMHKWSSRMGHFLYLCSDFGWSVIMSTVKDEDPADIRPELVHVRKGTPTNEKTKERKLRIRDGTGFTNKEYPDVYQLQRGPEYIPRTVATVSKRTEYWAVQSQEFELTLYYSVVPTPEWRQYQVTPFEAFTGCRAMQESLWQTFSTEDCEHGGINHGTIQNPSIPIKLGPDAVALLGWSTAGEVLQPWTERILIMLTRGERHIRWLAIIKATMGRGLEARYREVMLRTKGCCEACALDQVASRPGRWTLIL